MVRAPKHSPVFERRTVEGGSVVIHRSQISGIVYQKEGNRLDITGNLIVWRLDVRYGWFDRPYTEKMWDVRIDSASFEARNPFQIDLLINAVLKAGFALNAQTATGIVDEALEWVKARETDMRTEIGIGNALPQLA